MPTSEPARPARRRLFSGGAASERVIIGGGTLLGFFLLWELVARTGLVDPLFISSPTRIASSGFAKSSSRAILARSAPGECSSPTFMKAQPHAAHASHRCHGSDMAEGEAVEIVNFNVTGVGVIPKPVLKEASGSLREAPRSSQVRRAHFGPSDVREAPVFRRRDLEAGMEIAGPAVIEEQTSTIVLYPEQTARVDPLLNLEVEL